MFDAVPEPSTAPCDASATLQVLFFGKVADRFGRSLAVAIPAAGCPVSELKARLREAGPEAAAALDEPGVRWAVERQMGTGDPIVLPGQEVAFFSAFSGG